MQNRMMTGAGGDRWVLLQNLSNTSKRPEGRRSHSVGHRIVRAGPGAFRPHEIVLPVFHDHERAFDIALGRDLLELSSIREGNETCEVIVKLRDVAVFPATISDVVRPVSVLEDERVDWLSTIVKLTDQWLPQIDLEWAAWSARTCDTDASHLLVVLNVVSAEKNVVPTVLVHHRRRPQSPLSPSHVAHIQDTGVLLPRHQILRRERVHEDLLAVRRRIGRVDPILVLKDVGFGVRIPTRQNRITRSRRLR